MSKISELSDGGVIQGGDTLIAVRSGGNVKVTYGGSTTANIDGGTIDGTVIGGSTAAAGSFTTLTASGDANFDSGTLFVDASANAVGIGTNSPSYNLDIISSGAGQARIQSASGSNAVFRIETAGLTDETKIYFGRSTDIAIGQIIYSHADDSMQFRTDDSEAMRIDSSGNLLVGKTILDSASNGFEARAIGTSYFTQTSFQAASFRRNTTDGEIINFFKDTAKAGSIGTGGGTLFIAGVTGSCGISFASSGGQPFILPTLPTGVGTDNSVNLGAASSRFEVLFAGTGTINTSDAREKTIVSEFTTDELNAAKQLSKEIGTYRFLSAVAKKGDDARKHIGMTVQRAIEIMEANSLDPFAYGFICYDAWEEKTVDHAAVESKDAEYDEEGNLISEAVKAKDAYTEVVQKAGDRYSFRPDELLFFIARGLEQRITALEG
jgi:hypothetical protein